MRKESIIQNVDQLQPNTRSIVVEEKKEMPVTAYPKSGKEQNSRSQVNYSQNKIQESVNQRVASPSNLSCDHGEAQQTINCECCMNKMKKLILELTEKDP